MTIDARELRIGNYCFDERGEIVQFDFNVSYWIEKWKPIPLSEDWLIKFGFEPNGVYKSMRRLLYTENNGKTYLVVTFDGEAWIEIHAETIRWENGNQVKKVKEMQTGIFPCRYVHTLQNIWICLTGEELTIKEQV